MTLFVAGMALETILFFSILAFQKKKKKKQFVTKEKGNAMKIIFILPQ